MLLLIYPYWIVKLTSVPPVTLPLYAFNLSILDCKILPARTTHNIQRTFNLSILDCKINCFIIRKHRVNLLIYPYWIVKCGKNGI